MTIASCKHGVGAFQPCRECDDETDKATIIAERDRLRAEVANRNQRALDGDKAKAAFDNVFDENERLRAELAELRRFRKAIMDYDSNLYDALADSDAAHKGEGE